MITSFRHVGIVVKDLEVSLHFYRDVLGLELRNEVEDKSSYISTLLGLKNAHLKAYKLKIPQGGGIELLQYYSPKAPEAFPCAIHQRAITHFALTIDNLNQAYARMVQQGVKFISPPQLAPGGAVNIVFCQDPDGNYIEITEDIKK